MSDIAATALASRTRPTDLDAMPWTPLSEGLSFKPLQFLADDRGYAALLRLEPGAAIPRHRHTGEIHALNVEGSRQLCGGEIIGPGGYVYEPSGNVDSWSALGESPLVVMIVVTGAVEYLAPDGGVHLRSTARTLEGAYLTHCAALGVAAQDLLDRA